MQPDPPPIYLPLLEQVMLAMEGGMKLDPDDMSFDFWMLLGAFRNEIR